MLSLLSESHTYHGVPLIKDLHYMPETYEWKFVLPLSDTV